MITRLRNILGLQTTEQKIEEYSLLKGELDDINGMTDELAESCLSRVNGFNEVLKSDNYSPEIKESVQKRYSNFLDGQKKEVIGLVNRRHKVEKSISSILKDDKIKEAVNEFEVLNNAKRNYKEGAISKNIYNEIIKSKKGKVHYSDNFVFWGDKLLLIQRATDDGGANKWCLPGGHVDAGESHEKAAVRELVEETGIEVKNAVLAGVYENEDVMIEYYTSSVESDTEPSILLDSSEHQSYKWFDIYKESLDDMEFPFNMKENIKKILLPEEVEAKNISKAVNMFIDGYISKEVLSDIVKARTGYYSDNSENRRLKRVGQKYGNKGVKEQTNTEPKKEAPIEEYAKQASDEALNTALKQSDDNKVKQAAKEELNERKEGGEDKADQPKENVSVDTEKKQEGENSPTSDKKEEVQIKDKVEELSDKYRDLMKQGMDDDFSDSFKTSEIHRKQKDLSRYISRVKEFEKTDKAEHLNKAQELLGLKSEQEIKDFFGDGDIIGIKVEDEGIAVLTDDCYCKRGFFGDSVTMAEFILNPDINKGEGKGSEIFFNQVNSFKKKGYRKLETFAAMGETYNGYYTWARLGYEMREGSLGRAKFKSRISEAEDENIKSVNSLSELMTFSEGRSWWKENGVQFNGEFDLSDNSKSMFILNKYMEEKKNAKK